MKVFFDCEFTGLHQHTTLISIGCVSENNQCFYAELTDYDQSQVDDWIREHVLRNLGNPGHGTYVQGDTATVAAKLKTWLESFGEQVEMWSDVYAYDWMLFNQLYGHAFNIPKCVYYIPFDLATLFKLKGIDPDVSREAFAQGTASAQKHNALWDAYVIRACYDRMHSPEFTLIDLDAPLPV